jgi:hypothetical protein
MNLPIILEIVEFVFSALINIYYLWSCSIYLILNMITVLIESIIRKFYNAFYIHDQVFIDIMKIFINSDFDFQ